MQEWLDGMEGRAAAAGADMACGLTYGGMFAVGKPQFAAATGAGGAAASAAAAQFVQDLPTPAFVLLGLIHGGGV
jgi:hypothetical protein